MARDPLPLHEREDFAAIASLERAAISRREFICRLGQRKVPAACSGEEQAKRKAEQAKREAEKAEVEREAKAAGREDL